MNSHKLAALPALLVLALLGAACGTVGATPLPTASPSVQPSSPPSPSVLPSPSPTPVDTPVGRVTSPAQAAAIVFASDARFGRMGPLHPGLIGQSTWYEASETSGGFSVLITTGSGDCQAGCIDRHTWTYLVDPNGTITLVADEGDDIDLQPVAGGDESALVTLTLLAGPICPVETVPADPGCAPRPVTNAEVVLRDPSGAEVGRGQSNDEGILVLEVAPGAYYIETLPVEGLMRSADAVAFAVAGGDVTGMVLSYDTGIR